MVTISLYIIFISTFLKSLCFSAHILTSPITMTLHKWLILSSCFTSWKTPIGPLKPLRRYSLSEDIFYIDLQSLLPTQYMLTGNVDLTELKWLVYRVVSFKLEFSLTARKVSSFLIPGVLHKAVILMLVKRIMWSCEPDWCCVGRMEM